MRYQVFLLPLAEADIQEAFNWYRERSPYAANAFRADVIGAIDKLEEDATMWPADPEGSRY